VQQTVTYAVADGVGWVTLNRPAVLNALDSQLAIALADAAEAAAADPAVFAVVVRGAGRAFCAGMDRTALAAGRIGPAFYRHWIRALNTLEDMGKLAVCVLHGHSIGGGLQLALACDVRIATEDAVIGLGATRHGLIPDGGVLRLARIVGLGRATALALLNDEVLPAGEGWLPAVRTLEAHSVLCDRCAPLRVSATSLHGRELLLATPNVAPPARTRY